MVTEGPKQAVAGGLMLFLPGIWVQKITTKQPDDSMIEVAICSMQQALAANNDTAPEGSWDPATEPIPDPEELAKEMEARYEAEEAAAAEAEATTDDTEATEPAATPDDGSPEPAGSTSEPSDAPATRPGGAAEGA